ncbi:hypothetical protein I4U23_030424 [Adineta vaga]|nr:hypothetical protein I4U23_030424 [Adineta vaga]
MNLKIKVITDFEKFDCSCSFFAATIILFIFWPIHELHFHLQNCQYSLLTASNPNITRFDYQLACQISFDECRCSTLPNNSISKSIKCITDTKAIAAHISPLVLYVLQIYIIFEVCSIVGKYSHLLRCLLHLLIFILFVLVAIGAYDGGCLHADTHIITLVAGVLISGLALGLYVYLREHYSHCELDDIDLDQTPTISNDDHETIKTVVIL